MKRLTWNKDRLFYEAYIDSEEDRLGYLVLEPVGAHIHWKWYQEAGVGMSPGCLQEVGDKQKELFFERKKEKEVKIHG